MPNMYKESVLLKLVPYLPAKLTRQLYILQNTSFQKKSKIPLFQKKWGLCLFHEKYVIEGIKNDVFWQICTS